ncbi:hypothetical protein BaRGS_00016683 [Batillaria attramentaria]|uniref:Akirin n=1 Tax=Batillaria attramentaria TaxID=370345 RepID=A0ABD0KXX9_9CAEN
MACAATLKRSLEFDPVHSPSHSSAKRRRCIPMTLTPKTPPTKFHHNSQSPFAGVAPKLTSEQIAASIAHEMKRMQRRRQLHFPAQSSSPVSTVAAALSESKSEDIPCSSSQENSPQMSQSFTTLFSSLSHNKKDAPLFTFRQVSLICERMMRERENEVQEYYDKVLNCKLAEQYEAFLKFNHDQLHRRFGSTEMSCEFFTLVLQCLVCDQAYPDDV